MNLAIQTLNKETKPLTMISNFPTFAVVTFNAGGNPVLACKASPFISTKQINHQFFSCIIK